MRLNPPGPAAARVIDQYRETIAQRVTLLYFETHPELENRWKGARKKCTEDNRRHLEYLCEALALGQPLLFTEYAAWAAALLEGLRIPGEALASNLAILRDVVVSQLDEPERVPASQYLDAAITRIEGAACAPAPFIEGTGEMDILAREYLAALLKGSRQDASRLILDAIGRGVAVKDVYLHVFERTQHEIGRLWQASEINVGKEHYCTAATQLIMSQLYPHIFTGERHSGVYVGACIAGDLHEIGGRMVADFFEMGGWNSCYLGANTPTASIVQTIAESKAGSEPRVLGISATMTWHLRAVQELIGKVRSEPSCAGVRILVGGYPFNLAPDLWRAVHADGSAPDADRAVTKASDLTTAIGGL